MQYGKRKEESGKMPALNVLYHASPPRTLRWKVEVHIPFGSVHGHRERD